MSSFIRAANKLGLFSNKFARKLVFKYCRPSIRPGIFPVHVIVSLICSICSLSTIGQFVNLFLVQ